MVEGASVVVDDVAEEQAPESRKRVRRLGDQEDYAVTFRGVPRRALHAHLEIRLTGKRLDVVLKNLGIRYGHDPLQPRAFEDGLLRCRPEEPDDLVERELLDHADLSTGPSTGLSASGRIEP